MRVNEHTPVTPEEIGRQARRRCVRQGMRSQIWSTSRVSRVGCAHSRRGWFCHGGAQRRRTLAAHADEGIRRPHCRTGDRLSGEYRPCAVGGRHYSRSIHAEAQQVEGSKRRLPFSIRCRRQTQGWFRHWLLRPNKSRPLERFAARETERSSPMVAPAVAVETAHSVEFVIARLERLPIAAN